MPADVLCDHFISSGADNYFLDDGPSPIPMEEAPVLLELSSGAKENIPTLIASGMRPYKTIHSAALPRDSWKDCKQRILAMLDTVHRSPLDFFLDLLDPEQTSYENYRSQWFLSSQSSPKMSRLLDRIFMHPKGHDWISDWMRGR